MATAQDKKEPQKEQEQQQSEPQYGSTEEYITALQGWMNQLYQLQCVAQSFPYFLATLQSQGSASVPLVPPNTERTSLPTPNVTTSATRPQQQQQQPQQQQQQPQQQQQQQTRQQQQTQQTQRGREYKIPPVWKRLAAETIDFTILFVIKLAVTFAVLDTFDLLSDMKNHDFEISNLKTDFVIDYQLAFQMTSEILVLELIHRVATCLFEGLCLHRGSGVAGGATPGKKIMGLRVIYCEWVAPTASDQAVVYPATDLGLPRAILRSVMKNLLLMFLFPVCFTFTAFHHNRTIYDVLAGSVVVEDAPIRRQNNHNNNINNRN